MRHTTIALMVAGACASFSVAAADATPNWNNETLSGDWNGTRAEWYRRGTQVQFSYKADLIHNHTGGLRTGTRAQGMLEGKLKLNLDTLADWQGTTAYLHLLGNHGGKANADLVGSSMGVNNSEVADNGIRVFHAWVQKNFWQDTLSVLGGIYPIDSEFYVTDSSGVFLHPSFGMAAELAATGAAGPSIFPYAGAGLRVKLQPSATYYAQVALSDGIPRDEDHPRRAVHFHLTGDGSLAVVEVGIRPAEFLHPTPVAEAPKGVPQSPEQVAEEKVEPISKVALGYFRYTRRFDDPVDVDPNSREAVRRHSSGIYLLAEQTLYSEPDAPSQGLAGFIRYGRTDGSTSPILYSMSAGFSYKGLINKRDDDVFGIAATRSRAADKFRLANAPLSTSETVVEVTYRALVTPWLAMQPSVMRIIHPGFDPALSSAWVTTLRAEIAF